MEKIKMRTRAESGKIELNEQELASVAGGYRLRCTHCNKLSGSVGPAGMTWFYMRHQHNGWGAVVYEGRNGDKWWT